MLHPQVLSLREKTLAIIAGVLLVVLAAFGYIQIVSANINGADLNGDGVITAEEQAQYDSANATEPVETRKTSQPDAQQIKDQQNHQRWQRDEFQRFNRDLEDLLRKLPNANATAFNEHLVQFKACIDAREPLIGTNQYWDSNSECDGYRNNLQQEWDDNLWPKKGCLDVKQNIANRVRENKDKERRKKNLLRDNPAADISQLNTIDAQINQILAQIQGLNCDTVTRDQVEDTEYSRQDLDELFQDWYWYIQPIEEAVNETRWITDATKDFERNIKRQYEKDMTREWTNLTRDREKQCTFGEEYGRPAGADENYAAAEEAYLELGGYIKTMQETLAARNQPDFEDARQSFWDAQQSFWDYVRETREACNQQQQFKDISKQLKNREQEFAKMKKEYERAKKQSGIENSSIQKILDDYEAILEKAATALAEDPQLWWQELEPDLNYLQQQFWDNVNRVQMARDVMRWYKDLQNEVKHRTNDLKNLQRDCSDAASALEDILDQMSDLLYKAGEALKQDPQEAQWILQEFDPLRWKWDETSESCRKGKEFKWEIDNIRNELKNAKEQVTNAIRSGQIDSKEGAVCLDFIDEVREELEDRIEKGQRPEEIFGWMQGVEKESYESCPFRDQLGGGPEQPNREFYEEWMRENVEGLDSRIAAKVLEKVSQEIVSKVVERIIRDPSMINNLLQAAGEKREQVVAQTLEATESYYGNDSAAQQQILALKAQILEREKQLDELMAKLTAAKAELQKLTDEIVSYNFYGSAGDAFIAEYEKFAEEAKTLSDAQVAQRLADLRAKKEKAIHESKKEKIAAGHLKFYDEDDNEWHSKFVNALAAKGIVAGKSTDEEGLKHFDPAGEVTIAETVTMAYRLIEGSKPQDSFGDSSLCNGKYRNQWMNNFLAWGQQHNLTILAGCVDVNRPALRWEVAQILGEIVNKGKLPASTETCFSDVGPKHGVINSAVCFAKARGFMAGVNNEALAWNRVNRAEAATIVKSAGEKGLGINFNGEEKAATQAIRAETPEQEPAPAVEEEEEENFDYEEDVYDGSAGGGGVDGNASVDRISED